MPTPTARIVDRVSDRLKLKQLRLLVAVGRHGSIQNAARELNISQPAATKMIKDLELDFEVTLFDRTNRGVVPTAFGEALIRHGQLILAQLSNAAQELDDLSEGNAGRVVVGTLLAASSQLLPQAIEHVLQARPKVAIKIVEGTNEVLMPALRRGEIDLVVGRLPTHRHRREITQDALYDEHIVAVVGPGHPLAGKKRLKFEDLKPFGWILPPTETSLRRQLDQYFVDQAQYAPPAQVESVSYLTNRMLLQSLDLIGLMPRQVVSQEAWTDALVQLDWTVPFGNRPVGVSYRDKAQLPPAGVAFLEALHTVAGRAP